MRTQMKGKGIQSEKTVWTLSQEAQGSLATTWKNIKHYPQGSPRTLLLIWRRANQEDLLNVSCAWAPDQNFDGKADLAAWG